MQSMDKFDIRCCDNLEFMQELKSESIDLIYCDILYGTGKKFKDYQDLMPMRSEIEPELLIHANQELNHALLVVTRIIQLGGTPVLNPADWRKFARCTYEAPVDPYVEAVLNQNLNGERCAINRYKDLADFTNGKDHTTHQMAATILNEESEHEQDIEEWLNDINRMKEELRKIRL